MSANSKELGIALKKYIDNRADGKEELRQLLQQKSSVDNKYSLLMDVRGDKYGSITGPHIAAKYNDLETMKYMLKEFTFDQKYDLLKIKGGKSGLSALHYAARNNRSLIITCLLTDFSQQQKYSLLQLQDEDGYTPLHRAAHEQKLEAVQAILTSLSLQQQIKLLNIKSKKGQTVTDIRPEIYKEYPVLIRLGIVILHIFTNNILLTPELTPSLLVKKFLCAWF